jgi:two-component system response regulator LytT
MIRCLAVDDEAYASGIIAGYISKIPDLQLVSTTTNPFEAIKLVQDGQVDLVFLDIQMPELNGIQFLKICGGNCKVILTTAYPEYALEGFEHDVIDYLLKPIPYERFHKSISKARLLIDKAITGKTETLPPEILPALEYLFIKGDSKNKFIKVDLKDILYVEGLKNYLSVYTSSQRLITYQSLKDFESQLPDSQFTRVHKSYIVALNKINLIDGNTIYVKDQSIPIGETYKEKFFKIIRDK